MQIGSQEVVELRVMYGLHEIHHMLGNDSTAFAFLGQDVPTTRCAGKHISVSPVAEGLIQVLPLSVGCRTLHTRNGHAQS